MSLRARVVILACIVFLVSMLLIIGWQLGQIGKAERQSFTKALADAKRAGLPVSAKDLQVALPPPDQNAAPLYDQMKHLVVYSFTVGVNVRAFPTVAEMQATRRELRRSAVLMTLIHQALVCPNCIYIRNWSDPNFVPSDEFGYMRMSMRLLRAESRVLDWDGKPLEAVHNQALGFQIVRQVASEKSHLAYLTAQNLDALTLSGLQQILYHDGGNPSVAEAVRAAVENGYRQLSLADALRFEFGQNMVMLDQLRKGGPRAFVKLAGEPPPQRAHGTSLSNWLGGKLGVDGWNSRDWNAFIDTSGVKLIRLMRQVIDVADRPFPEANRVVMAVSKVQEQDKAPTNTICTLLFLVFDNFASSRAGLDARAEETRAGAAVLAWKARHGAFPDTLEAVMNPAPVDPFDGKPLRYRREGAGFVIYAVGKDGTFDGGTPDKKPGGDTAFHYPMPAYMKTK